MSDGPAAGQARIGRCLRRNVRPDPRRPPGGRRRRPPSALGLERVLFIPAGQPPHKPGRAITSGEHRLAMVELAIAGNDRVPGRAAIELDRGGSVLHGRHARGAVGRTSGSDGGRGRPDLTLVLSAEAFLGLHDLARSAPRPRTGTGSWWRRATATRTPARSSWRAHLPDAAPIAPRSSTGPGCACRRASSETARRPVDRCATSSRMRSRRISATMGCTSRPPEEHPHRDRTRPASNARRIRDRDRATRRRSAHACQARAAAPAIAPRSNSRAASSSWPRTRRPPTSCCSTSRR